MPESIHSRVSILTSVLPPHPGGVNPPTHTPITSGEYVTNDTPIVFIGFPSMSSINGLPDEILLRIFDYVPKMKPCPAGPRPYITKRSRFLTDPVSLSHVCSRWRRVVLNAPGLWSHIDLQPDVDTAELSRTVARLEAFLERSRPAVLDVHILDPPAPPELKHIIDWDRKRAQFDKLRAINYLRPFLESIAPRTQYLTLDGSSSLDGQLQPNQTLAEFLVKCVPGTLKTLNIHIPSNQLTPGSFREPDEFIHIHTIMGGLEEELESLFHSITTLRL
ncbi:hypothetical protein FRC11_009758, partial [Ceratobasidium sp. 423]